MSAFFEYLKATSERHCAFERFNYASSALDMARIRERLAEIKSQHQPLASLLDAQISERDRLYAAAFYVVVGRMPQQSRLSHGEISTTASRETQKE